jgi:hypothetical protein
MANLLTYANSVFKPYYKYITALFLVILFVLVSKFLYDTYFLRFKKNKPYSNVANSKNTKDICAIYFFSVKWCPHCKKAEPEWNAFKDQYNNKVINGYILKCYYIDCTEDNGDEIVLDNSIVSYIEDSDKGLQTTKTEIVSVETPIKPTPIKITTLIKKYNIDSYPTVKLTKGDMVIDFDSKITKETLTQFVNSV